MEYVAPCRQVTIEPKSFKRPLFFGVKLISQEVIIEDALEVVVLFAKYTIKSRGDSDVVQDDRSIPLPDHGVNKGKGKAKEEDFSI